MWWRRARSMAAGFEGVSRAAEMPARFFDGDTTGDQCFRQRPVLLQQAYEQMAVANLLVLQRSASSAANLSTRLHSSLNAISTDVRTCSLLAGFLRWISPRISSSGILPEPSLLRLNLAGGWLPTCPSCSRSSRNRARPGAAPELYESSPGATCQATGIRFRCAGAQAFDFPRQRKTARALPHDSGEDRRDMPVLDAAVGRPDLLR
jgi:hypothetical protein